MLLNLLVDVTKLSVSVRMLGTLQRLGGALQAEPGLPQQLGNRGRRDQVPLPGQFLGQVPQ
jgi:hypothetical protein